MRNYPITSFAVVVALYTGWPVQDWYAYAQQKVASSDGPAGSGASTSPDSSAVNAAGNAITEYVSSGKTGQAGSLPSEMGNAGPQGGNNDLKSMHIEPGSEPSPDASGAGKADKPDPIKPSPDESGAGKGKDKTDPAKPGPDASGVGKADKPDPVKPSPDASGAGKEKDRTDPAKPGPDASGASKEKDKPDTAEPGPVPADGSHKTIYGKVMSDTAAASAPGANYSPALGDPWLNVSKSVALTANDIEVVQTGTPTKPEDISYNPKFPVYGNLYYSPKISTNKELVKMSVGVSVGDASAEIGMDFNGRPNIQASVTVRGFKKSVIVEPGAGTYNAGEELLRAISSIYETCLPSLGACN